MDAPSPLPALIYLDAAAVEASLPPLAERLRLAEQTMRALVGDAELPPKIGVHPRPQGSFAHAMPAWLDGGAEDASADLLGLKWVIGFPANARRGRPVIHATVVLDDPATGVPMAILDGSPITANRTAAVSGVAMRHWSRRCGRPPRAAILGAGVQARSHLPVLGAVLPGVNVAVHDRHQDRAAALADAAGARPGSGPRRGPVGRRRCARRRRGDHRHLFGPTARRWVRMSSRATRWWWPSTTTCLRGGRGPRGGPLPGRRAGPVPGRAGHGTIRRLSGARRDDRRGARGRDGPTAGPRAVTHLGVGLADVIFGAAITARGRELGLGTVLPR